MQAVLPPHMPTTTATKWSLGEGGTHTAAKGKNCGGEEARVFAVAFAPRLAWLRLAPREGREGVGAQGALRVDEVPGESARERGGGVRGAAGGGGATRRGALEAVAASARWLGAPASEASGRSTAASQARTPELRRATAAPARGSPSPPRGSTALPRTAALALCAAARGAMAKAADAATTAMGSAGAGVARGPGQYLRGAAPRCAAVGHAAMPRWMAQAPGPPRLPPPACVAGTCVCGIHGPVTCTPVAQPNQPSTSRTSLAEVGARGEARGVAAQEAREWVNVNGQTSEEPEAARRQCRLCALHALQGRGQSKGPSAEAAAAPSCGDPTKPTTKA